MPGGCREPGAGRVMVGSGLDKPGTRRVGGGHLGGRGAGRVSTVGRRGSVAGLPWDAGGWYVEMSPFVTLVAR